MSDITHSELIQEVATWLAGQCHWPRLIEPRHPRVQEEPDVLSMSDKGDTWVWEVKVSHADFVADTKKPHRKDPRLGMGNGRVIVCPAGLIDPDEVDAYMGLAWYDPKLEQIVPQRHGIRQSLSDRAYCDQNLLFAQAMSNLNRANHDPNEVRKGTKHHIPKVWHGIICQCASAADTGATAKGIAVVIDMEFNPKLKRGLIAKRIAEGVRANEIPGLKAEGRPTRIIDVSKEAANV